MESRIGGREGVEISLVRDRTRGGRGGGYIGLNFLNTTDVGREWWREGCKRGIEIEILICTQNMFALFGQVTRISIKKNYHLTSSKN